MAAILVLSVAMGATVRAQEAEPPAATQPSTEQLSQWLADLAHNNADIRETARINLMGLSRRQLETFRTVVAQHQPLLPAQVATLREIVLHAYAAEEPYPGQREMGFLGVELRTAPLPSQDAADIQPSGVLITDRLLGFCGYRMLQDGDIVLGLANQPETRTDAFLDLAGIIRSHPAGTELQLEVFRRGSFIVVPIVLDARPTDLDRFQNLDALRSLRFRRAYDYWQQNFQPLVERGVSSSGSHRGREAAVVAQADACHATRG